MKDIIEEQSGAYIQDKAAALGIDCQVTVEGRTGRKSGLFHSRLPSWAA